MRAGLYLLIGFLICFMSSCSSIKHDHLYQVSTIDALLAGVYDSKISIGELKKYGDFGLGTFNKLDGELLALDGQVFQVDYEGIVHEVKDSIQTPFISMNFFKADESMTMQANDFGSLKELIKRVISKQEGENLPYAIKVHGTFDSLKLRSVPAQQEKPYAELKDIIKSQSIFDYKNITGTMIGYWLPKYFAHFNVPGFHFHFISDDKSKGGHVLAFQGMKSGSEGNIQLDELNDFEVKLLEENDDFRLANTSKDRSEELHKVEK